MTVGQCIDDTTQAFAQADIPTARLDALVLLADTLGKDKAWLLAHPDHELGDEAYASLQPLIAARTRRIPLAYIRGVQEFYGRPFIVDANVLIPRPETEQVIELIKQTAPAGRMLDVGTGSGAIAISAALEQPALHVDACDISFAALQVARRNAKVLQATIRFFESDLLTRVDGAYDVIAANLPYVSGSWQRSPETNAEPPQALYADDDGLALIKRLIDQIPGHLAQHGLLVLEADPRQHATIIEYAQSHELTHEQTTGFALSFRYTGPASR